MQRWIIGAACVGMVASASSAQCVWGSFDASRINYAGGVLSTGSNFVTLRGLIMGGGGTLAAGTSELTSAYLAGVSVFFTSLLTNNEVPLSASEQAALQAWVASGGTLIVTADIFNLPGYNSFTSFLGVTNYVSISHQGSGPVINAHPLTAGVATMSYNTNATFSIPASALTLANDALGNRYSAVMDPATGFAGPGRLFIVGDHNMLTETLINANLTLATNMVAWACDAPSICYADCEGDGDLDVFDFLCFQGAFANQDPYADCEQDGDWDVFDFLCFQGLFANGCD